MCYGKTSKHIFKDEHMQTIIINHFVANMSCEVCGFVITVLPAVVFIFTTMFNLHLITYPPRILHLLPRLT